NPFRTFNRLKECRYGRMLYNVNDIYVGRSLDLYGEFSEGEVEVFRKTIRAGDVVVEAGANIGAHTVYLARETGPQGAVIAFEPQRLVFQTLCANIALNSFTNVICKQSAVGDAPGTLLVPSLDPARENNFGGLSLLGHSHGEPVPVVRLDDLGLARCRLLKVDVEGMELQVLKGAAKLIERCTPALYVENDRTENSADLVRFIDSLNYDAYWHLPPLYNPQNFQRNPDNVFGPTHSINMLCLKRGTYGTCDLPRVQMP
ncbi:MAG TPA: FkbM family methyltransferase, partial [Tepidisphaeraceae bacterium]|nr:FkbM family methyltransferase [Tepidisphaeraceae bacterium]